MKPKILLIVAIIYSMILLAVPCYIIYNYHDILSTGETYKINVTAYDPYDPFRGRYVEIRPALTDLRWTSGYIKLIKNEDDFVISAQNVSDAKTNDCVKDLKIERYYMNEKIAPKIEERQRRAVQDGDLIYIVIKVKNGSYAIEGLYINGIAAEEYVK